MANTTDSTQGNIFDAAANCNTTKKQQEPKEASETTLQETFSRCQKIHEEIATNLEKNLKQGKITPSKIRNFISHPKNFSQKDWKVIQEQKDKNEKLLKALSEKISKKSNQKFNKKPKKKIKKGCKPMTKRNWLQMR